MATNHQSGKGSKNPDAASETGKKSGSSNSGNFKSNPGRASEAGKKGGEHSHSGGSKS